MKNFCLLFLLIPTILCAQNISERTLKTEIQSVTVFLNGAQITEMGSINIPTGNSVIRIKNLSTFLDDKSLQVKGEGEFTILSVNNKLNFLSENAKSKTVDSLQTQFNLASNRIAKAEARLEVLRAKTDLLNANRNLGGSNVSTTMAQLKTAMDFFDAEITKIKDEELKLRTEIQRAIQERNRLDIQLKDANNQQPKPSNEVEIRVSATKPIAAKFNISYLVTNAGWYPKYDVRVKDVNSPLELSYKAEVYQNTGIDWNNVKLKFSNGNPYQSGVLPDLST